jgi:phosphinothricin acetyltransferase
MHTLLIRLATPADCSAIQQIYAHYVAHTSITFEYDVPPAAEMEKRMHAAMSKYPYLVAEAEGKIAGYAYATDFRYRSAYQWSPECTIYLHPEEQGKGTGFRLYTALFDALRLQGFYNVFGGVALPNDASVALHRKCNFREIGLYENIGYKQGKWHSTLWFQRVLQPHAHGPAAPRAAQELFADEEFQQLLRSHSL